MIHSAYLQHWEVSPNKIVVVSRWRADLIGDEFFGYVDLCSLFLWPFSFFPFPFLFFLHLDVLEKNDSPPLVGLWERANESLLESLTFRKVSLFLFSFFSFFFLFFSFLFFKILFSSLPQMKCNRSFISKKEGKFLNHLPAPVIQMNLGICLRACAHRSPTPAAATPAVTLCFSTWYQSQDGPPPRSHCNCFDFDVVHTACIHWLNPILDSRVSNLASLSLRQKRYSKASPTWRIS